MYVYIHICVGISSSSFSIFITFKKKRVAKFSVIFANTKNTTGSMLSRLRNAVRKVKLLLSLNLQRWRIASMIGASSGKRRLSFNDRPGLRACTDDSYYIEEDNSDSGSASFSSCRSPAGLHRTISYPSEDDIDKRAEMFIANFHKQLQIERQISLELQYWRANSVESLSPQ